MNYQDIEVASHDRIAILSLARPERLNAYTPDMGVELVAAIREALVDPEMDAIILTGKGRGFCAGADRDFADGRTGRHGYSLGRELFIRGFAGEMAQAEKPLIAAIGGPALGIGATMTLPFDFRLATQAATFEFSFCRLGVLPGMGASYFLPRIVGGGRARDLMLAGGRLTAEEAFEIGLVREVTHQNDLIDRAVALAKSLTKHGAEFFAALKRVTVSGSTATLGAAMAAELAEIDQWQRLPNAAAERGGND